MKRRSKARSNPAPYNSRNFWSSLVINAVKAPPEMKRELRPAMAALRGKEPTLEDACEFASDVLGIDPRRIREQSLTYLADHVNKKFDDPRNALHWLADRDTRLYIWSALACASWAFEHLPSEVENSRALATRMKAGIACLSISAKWVEGLASVEEVTALSYGPLDPPTSNIALNSAVSSTQAAALAIEDSELTPGIKHYVAKASASDAAVAAAFAVADPNTPVWYEIYTRSLRDLVGVIADAMNAFPPLARPRSNPKLDESIDTRYGVHMRAKKRSNPTKYQKATTAFIKKLPPDLNRRDIVAIMKYVREMDLEYSEVSSGPQRALYVIPWLTELLTKQDRGMVDILSQKAEELCESVGWKDADGYDIDGYPSTAAVALSLAVNGSPLAQQWLRRNFPALA